MADHGRRPSPYRLITTSDPDRTLGQGDVTYHATMLEASNAFVQSDALCKQIVFDDGCRARHLIDREEQLLGHVCSMLGYELEDVA